MNSFNNKKIVILKNTPKYIRIWIFTLLIVLITFYILLNIKYEKRDCYDFLYNESLISYLTDEDINNFNDFVIIDDLKYDININSISEQYYLNEFREFKITVNKNFIKNEKVRVCSYKETSIYKNIKEKIKEDLWN